MLRPEAEGDVVEDSHVGEEDVVLEHQADATMLGRHMPCGGRVVEHLAVQLDVSLEWDQPRERAKQRRLARAVRPEHGDRLPGAGRELDVEREAAAAGFDRGPQAHNEPSQRSRMPMRIANDTASRIRLKTIAPSGRVSSAT